MIEEKDLKGDIIVRTVDNLIYDVARLDSMKKKLGDLQVADSATIIYNNIKNLIDRK